MVKKQSQLISMPISSFDSKPSPGDSFVMDFLNNQNVIIEDDEDTDESVFEYEDDEDNKTKEPKEVVFVLKGKIPGAPEDIEDDEPDDDLDKKEEIVEVQEEIDSWNWEKSCGLKKFLNWVKDMIDGVPAHSGSDTTGLERAIAYFERLNAEISRAMRKDFKREIDAAKAEEARSTIEDGIKRLVERLEKLRAKKFNKSKKKADNTNDNLVKTADTSFTGKMQVQVPYFISFLARTCVDSTVSSGKDMTETFVTLAKDYKLDDREKVQVIQLIKDMGFPIYMNRLKIKDGKLDMSDHEDNAFLAQYPA